MMASEKIYLCASETTEMISQANILAKVSNCKFTAASDVLKYFIFNILKRFLISILGMLCLLTMLLFKRLFEFFSIWAISSSSRLGLYLVRLCIILQRNVKLLFLIPPSYYPVVTFCQHVHETSCYWLSLIQFLPSFTTLVWVATEKILTVANVLYPVRRGLFC